MWQILDGHGMPVAEVSEDGRRVVGDEKVAAYLTRMLGKFAADHSTDKVEDFVADHMTKVSSLTAHKVAGGVTSRYFPRRVGSK